MSKRFESLMDERERNKAIDLQYIRGKRRERGSTVKRATTQECIKFVQDNPDKVAYCWYGCAFLAGGMTLRTIRSYYLGPSLGRIAVGQEYKKPKHKRDYPTEKCTCFPEGQDSDHISNYEKYSDRESTE